MSGCIFQCATIVLVLCCTWVWCEGLEQPNVILFLADDMGYGDLSVYGHPSQEWGPVDDMATEGLRFTNWYATDSVCTPSRAALLTGRYAFRSGMIAGEWSPTMTGENRWVRAILEFSSTGLPKEDVTLAEALKATGYTTGIVGKWHLGNSLGLAAFVIMLRRFSILEADRRYRSAILTLLSLEGNVNFETASAWFF